MQILAIESSCDETAAAVVLDGRTVLSSVIASQVERHIVFGGVVPAIASRMHCEAVSQVTRRALLGANTEIDEIDAVAVTAYPGLIGALLVGVNFAKSLAYSAGKPLVPVHHLRGHIASLYISNPELDPPFLCLVVSGGHTHIVEVSDYTSLKTIGKTRDDAAGEAFDKTARTLGLPYPGGAHMDAAAQDGDPHAYKFPTPKIADNPYDFSFSGLKSAVINTIHNHRQKNEEINLPDMAASIRYSITNILCAKFLSAAGGLGYDKLGIAGGVAANSELREKLTLRCGERGYTLYLPEKKWCGDNAAMIGAQAYYEYMAGSRAELDLNARASASIE